MNRNSPLLRLPTEIRQEIWKHALGGKTYLASCFSGRYYCKDSRFAPSAEEPRNGMALLRTCRQIYSEAVLYPFFNAIFAYHDLTYLKRSIKGLQGYQSRHVTHLRIDCRKYGPNFLHVADSGLLSDNKLDFKKHFPALARVTVLVHGITDAYRGADLQPFEASVDVIPPHLRTIIEGSGVAPVVGSTYDEIEPREVNEIDDGGEKGEMTEVEEYWQTFIGMDWEQVQGQI